MALDRKQYSMKSAASIQLLLSRLFAVALTVLSGTVLLGGTATAAPPAITAIEKDGRTWHLTVHSAAMDSEIRIDVLRPADESRPAPNLYMLNGLDAGLGKMNWQGQTKALDWLADQPVNVIQPIGGRGSYYTDWLRPDPKLGVNKWKT
ncbi:hypothetical protein AB0C20_36410, partial [Micromonospora sp. NPDC048843]